VAVLRFTAVHLHTSEYVRFMTKKRALSHEKRFGVRIAVS
jgi:hypothetical protein